MVLFRNSSVKVIVIIKLKMVMTAYCDADLELLIMAYSIPLSQCVGQKYRMMLLLYIYLFNLFILITEK